MVRVPPPRDFGQEMCERSPTRYASPDGGSNPVASEPAKEFSFFNYFCRRFSRKDVRVWGKPYCW